MSQVRALAQTLIFFIVIVCVHLQVKNWIIRCIFHLAHSNVTCNHFFNHAGEIGCQHMKVPLASAIIRQCLMTACMNQCALVNIWKTLFPRVESHGLKWDNRMRKAGAKKVYRGQVCIKENSPAVTPHSQILQECHCWKWSLFHFSPYCASLHPL